MGIPDYLSCLLRNLYAGQETTGTTGHGTMNWFKIGKGVHQSCILSPCLFNLYAGYIMRNAGLEEAQAGIKTAGRNINNFRYADDTTSGARNPPCLLIMPGLLRSDRGGLSVSSPSGEAYVSGANFLSWSFIGLPRKPSYSASFLHWIFLLSYPYSIP